MDMEMEHEYWKMECGKLILVRSNKSTSKDFDMVALHEIRLGSAIQKFDNFALFNNRAESKKHEFGCIFYVRGEFLKYAKDFKIINERIYYFRLTDKWFSCTFIKVHALTNEKTEEVKEEFYISLEQNINQIANSDINVILGDFNAKVGKEEIYCIYTNPSLAMKVYIMKPTTTE